MKIGLILVTLFSMVIAGQMYALDGKYQCTVAGEEIIANYNNTVKCVDIDVSGLFYKKNCDNINYKLYTNNTIELYNYNDCFSGAISSLEMSYNPDNNVVNVVAVVEGESEKCDLDYIS